MSDSISRQDTINLLMKRADELKGIMGDLGGACNGAAKLVERLPSAEPKTGWIPVSERLPEHSYTKRFWLTVKLDDDKGTVATLIGTWGAWGGKGNKPYDAFDCWKDVMINGGIHRMSQPIPKEQVLAWMPLPEPYREDGEV